MLLSAVYSETRSARWINGRWMHMWYRKHSGVSALGFRWQVHRYLL